VTLFEWAVKHRIAPEALRELCQTCLFLDEPDEGISEAIISKENRLDAANKNMYLFRNNRGAGRMESGNYVRYGLANESKKLGDSVKSADLVGWEPFIILPEHVGYRVARFLSVETKAGDWKFSGTLEEMAQVKWAALVNAEGGRAIITNRVGDL
jgi:hypothetical protein